MLSILLSLFLGCGEPVPPVVPPGPAPADRAMAVRQQLDTAKRRWTRGERAAAAALVLDVYAREFEPLEPALRAQDPGMTLALEHAFGKVAWRMGRKGGADELSTDLLALQTGVDAAFAQLPAPSPVPDVVGSEDVPLEQAVIGEP